jgi:UDP-glucose:(heptosyl)LPS alpha-1,3-glucosyltransferase
MAMVLFALLAARRTARGGFDIVHGTGKCLGVDVFNPHGGVERAWLVQHYRCAPPLYRLLLRVKRALSLRHYFTLWQQARLFGPRGARLTVAISDMVLRDILAHHPAASKDRIRVLYNGVDLTAFHPRDPKTIRAEERTRLGLAGEDTVLLHVSHNFRLKGLDPLLRSLPKVAEMAGDRPFQLLVAGRGRPGPWERLARSLGVAGRIRFLGVHPSMARLYAAADICVHPTFYDPCSLTVFEAMAAGLPVVTTRQNGAAWAMAGDEGVVLTDPLDIDALARATVSLFDPEVRKKAQDRARATAERFPAAVNADKMMSLYREMLKEAPSP